MCSERRLEVGDLLAEGAAQSHRNLGFIVRVPESHGKVSGRDVHTCVSGSWAVVHYVWALLSEAMQDSIGAFPGMVQNRAQFVPLSIDTERMSKVLGC